MMYVINGASYLIERCVNRVQCLNNNDRIFKAELYKNTLMKRQEPLMFISSCV